MPNHSLHTDRPGSITAKTLYKRVYEAGGAEPNVPPEEDFEPWDGEEEPASEMPSELAELCRRWVWVADANAFFDRIDGRSYNNAQFEGRYCHLVPAKTTIVRQALRGILPMLTLNALSYRPGTGELPGDDTLNLWRPSDVVPKAGDVSWFLDHMAHLVPDDRERGKYQLPSVLLRKYSLSQ